MQYFGRLRRSAVGPYFFAALASMGLVRCNCDEVEEFRPAATYDPDDVLSFGVVSVRSQKTLSIQVVSNGRAALEVDAAGSTVEAATEDARSDANGSFLVNFAEDLAALRPGTTSTITVTYRPCPAAWEGGWGGSRLKETFDYSTCPEAADEAVLNIKDNTRQTENEGGIPVVLSGRPGQPPQLRLYCSDSQSQACGLMPDLADSIGCVALTFGNVSAVNEPCDLALEIRNEKRDGRETGDLVVERLEILVSDTNGDAVLRTGDEAGFSILDANGNPLAIDSDNPLRVPIPVGAESGTVRLKVRFDGSVPSVGTWLGVANQADPSAGGGLRVYSNDPDQQPVASVLVSGTGTAPDIQVVHPGKIDFGNVPQGTSSMDSVQIRNAGNADLQITDMRLRDSAGNTFTFTTSQGSPPFTVLPTGSGANVVDVNVTYTPSGSGFDADAILVGSNDPDEPEVAIPLTGGAAPRIDVQPSPTVVFPIDGDGTQEIVISNVGFGDLQIQSFELTGPAPEEDRNHTSVNDFTIQGCTQNPCPQSLTLCSPNTPGCTSSEATFTVVYDNDDASQTDLVSLKIQSNDPNNLTWTVVLSATDVPCLYPTPVLTVETPAQDRVQGMPITVNGNASTPGSGTVVTNFTWAFQFAPGAYPPITEVTPGDPSRISFTPETPGLYILGLDVQNDCGALSQRPKTERISVSPP